MRMKGPSIRTEDAAVHQWTARQWSGAESVACSAVAADAVGDVGDEGRIQDLGHTQAGVRAGGHQSAVDNSQPALHRPPLDHPRRLSSCSWEQRGQCTPEERARDRMTWPGPTKPTSLPTRESLEKWGPTQNTQHQRCHQRTALEKRQRCTSTQSSTLPGGNANQPVVSLANR